MVFNFFKKAFQSKNSHDKNSEKKEKNNINIEKNNINRESSFSEVFKKKRENWGKTRCTCFMLCCFCPKLICSDCLKSCRLTLNNRVI